MRVKLIKDYKLYPSGQDLTVTPEKGAELIKEGFAKEIVRYKPEEEKNSNTPKI